MINVLQRRPGLSQAVGDRLARQSGPMFYPRKTLLFDGGNQFTIYDDACR
jgi:hypothetical protein